MCTVIFIPGKDEYYFASLRDENTERPKASHPQLYTNVGLSFLAPKDGLAGGTWLGINEMGQVIILLNGALKKHNPGKQYRKSRGLIVSELLAISNPADYWHLMDLNGIEPFTLIAGNEENLYQLIWNGEQKKQICLNNNQPYIWSSSTLYDTEAKAQREFFFQQWMAGNPAISMETLLSFFLRYTDTENGFIIDRKEKIKTISYSFITVKKSYSGIMQYYDLANNQVSSKEINFIKSSALCPAV